MGERPGRKQRFDRGAEPVVGQIGQSYRCLLSKSMVRAHPDQQRLSAKHQIGQPFGLVREAAREANVNTAIRDRIDQGGQPVGTVAAFLSGYGLLMVLAQLRLMPAFLR